MHKSTGSQQRHALLDSGAQVTVIPAHLVSLSTWNAAGLMSEGPLPIATVTVSIEDTDSRKRVLVKEVLKEVLLGQDYPDLKQLLSKGMMDFTAPPLTGILGPVEEANSTREVLHTSRRERNVRQRKPKIWETTMAQSW